jgi:hypothetical protein
LKRLLPTGDALISRGKPATQSSISEWSRAPTVQQDAAIAVNGAYDNRKFHTARQQDPWWQVDLGGFFNITEIRLYNALDHTAGRFRHFSLAVSIDGQSWAEICRKEDDSPVGGVDGNFYTWRGVWPAWGRFVRVTLLAMDYLHLSQVEIFSFDPKAMRNVTISQSGPGSRINPAGDVTVVLTSCGRHDLLERTLESFQKYNSYAGIREILVVEDGTTDPQAVCDKFGARLIRLNERKGQAFAIDAGYAHVTTPYIFHCEDDWEFYDTGFIEKSLAVLRVDLSCVCVWLRAWSDCHPLSFRSACTRFGVLSLGYLDRWHGFTWNPGLRRKADYELAGPFSRHLNFEQDLHESLAGERYRALGFRAVVLDEAGYVRHIGEQRHVDNPDWQ